MAAAIFAGLLLLVVAGWRFVCGDGQPLLDEARSWLSACLSADGSDPAANTASLLQAADATRRYLDRGGRDTDPAMLLRCVALTLLGHNNADRPVAEQMEIEQLLSEISARNCPPDDLLLAITAFRRVGDLGKADWLIGWALQSGDESPALLRIATAVRYDLGRESDALAHCQRLTEIRPQDLEPWQMLAMMHEDAGATEKLIDALDELISRLPPPAIDERLKLVQQLIVVGNANRARAEFARLEQEAPQRLAQSPLIEAGLLMLEGRAADALPRIEQARSDAPDAPETMLMHGRILLAQNRLDEAQPLLERLVELDPTNNEAHYLLGQTLARRGETEAAERHLRQHRKLLDLRVRIHRLERVAGKATDDVGVRLELVQLYEELELSEMARFWQRAADLARAAADSQH
jgi:Flp pilus assembly protein TadD